MDLTSSFSDSRDETTVAIYAVIDTLGSADLAYDGIVPDDDSEVGDAPDLAPSDLVGGRESLNTRSETTIVDAGVVEQPPSSTDDAVSILARDRRSPRQPRSADPAEDPGPDAHGSGGAAGDDRSMIVDGIPAGLEERANRDAGRNSGDSHSLDRANDSLGAENSQDFEAAPEHERTEALGPDQRESGEKPVEGVARIGVARPDQGRESPLVKAALEFLKRDPAQYQSFKQQLEAFDALDEAAKERAAAQIWELAADVVRRVLTERNLLQAYRDGLIKWWEDPDRVASTEDEIRERHTFLPWVWDTMKELAEDILEGVLEEAVKAAVIEMIFPGAHLIFPPLGLADAFFTAGGLGGPAGHMG